jgi:hypothetical protein
VRLTTTLEAFGRQWALSLSQEPVTEVEAAEPDPQGSQCGDLGRAEAWDHDKRVPVGFAGPTRPPWAGVL